MDREEAIKILGKSTIDDKDGGLYCLGKYLGWTPRDKEAVLDGRFTAEELEAIAWWMKNEAAAQGKSITDRFSLRRISGYFVAASLLVGCEHGTFHFEDDYLSGWLIHNSDSFYTAGEQFDYDKYAPSEKESYSLGNVMYTPSDKHANANPEGLKRDRPYAGFTFLQYRASKLDTDILTTYGIALGCSGPCSFSKQIQQTFHKAIGQGIPAWNKNDEIRSEPDILLQYEKEKFLVAFPYADLKVFGKGKAGTLVDSLGLGSELRVGYGLEPFEAPPIVFKLGKPTTWRAYLFTSFEERYVPFNEMLEGSLWQSEPHTVTPERLMNESNFGFTIGYKNIDASYRITSFSKEWKTAPGSFQFGAVTISW